MIDWTKEKTTQNYCGYCDQTPTGSSCDRSCFENTKNKVSHALDVLMSIPKEIEALKKREQDFKEFLHSK